MRDLQGYGRRRPLAQWPGAARIALSFVLNYEEGGERNVLDGDAQAETYLVPEVIGLPPVAGRSPIAEDLFEYGSRAWLLEGLTALRRASHAFHLLGRGARAEAQSGSGTRHGGSGARSGEPLLAMGRL